MDPSETDVTLSAPSVEPPVVPPRTYMDVVNNDVISSQTNTQPEAHEMAQITPYPPTDTMAPYPPPSASFPQYEPIENSPVVGAPVTQPQHNPPGDPLTAPESITLPYPCGNTQSSADYTAPYPAPCPDTPATNNSPYPPPAVRPATLNSTPYPPNDNMSSTVIYIDINNGTSGPNENSDSAIINTNTQGSDVTPRSVEGHVLIKLPSYHGGGDFPAEPPPSYAESYPVQIPESMVPRQPTQTPHQGDVAPATQVISETYRDTPISTLCPICGENVTTLTASVAGGLTYIVMFIILLLGGWFGCCLIPFCVTGLKDVHHRCPNCKRVIGRYERMG